MQYLGIVSLLIVLVTAGRWLQRAWRVDIPHDPIGFQMLWAVGLFLGGLAWYLDASASFAWWGVGTALGFLYLSFTGAQRADGEMIELGDVIPSFSALDDAGAIFESSSLAGSRVLLKFFRGHW